MPRGDRMGTNGMGPMTGRSLGYCNGYDSPGFTKGAPRGGAGFARRFSRGFERDYRRGFGNQGFSSYPNYFHNIQQKVKKSILNQKWVHLRMSSKQWKHDFPS